MRILQGSPVSPGYGEGRAYVYEPNVLPAEEQHFQGDAAPKLAALDQALQTAGEQLDALIEQVATSAGADKAQIFFAHKMLLEDEELLEMTREAIREERLEPANALHRTVETFCALLGSAQDPLIASRVADLRDVERRVTGILTGQKGGGLYELPENTVLVARDLLPSDTASLNTQAVVGIVTEEGGATSHTAILAKNLGIPAVLGVPGACEALQDAAVALDAVRGEVAFDPDGAYMHAFGERKAAYDRMRRDEAAYYLREAVMADGTPIHIGLNVGSTEDEGYEACSFVGLLRSEFLYMHADRLPTEQQQYEAYRAVVQKAGGRPVVVRTLDIGGDKTLPYMELPQEDNPFLGLRALRLCFAHRDLFLTQLCAILRASAHGPVQIMLPMVGSMEDVRMGRAAVEEAKQLLRGRGEAFDQHIPVGVMIEIPSIALLAEQVAREVDFASIGTNDLCQYLCAADRLNPQVRQYYQSFSPALLSLVAGVARAFEHAGKPLSICGELAGDPRAVALLAGLGVRKLSMSRSQIAAVKRALSRVTLPQAQALAGRALAAATQQEVLDML